MILPPILNDMFQQARSLRDELRLFNSFLRRHFKKRAYTLFSRFEAVKDIIVDLLYKRRGKYARPFLHGLMFVILFVGITLGPLIVKSQATEGTNLEALPSNVIMSSSGQDVGMGGVVTTQGEEVAKYRGGEVITHTVVEGETLSTIAKKYDLSTNTLVWLNNLDEKKPIQAGQQIKILPVDGVLHKVKKGDTICSIARTYGLLEKDEDCGSGAQPIVDYPFNTFTNDEFGLQVGQYIVVPDGVMPKPQEPARPAIARRLTPNAGAVSATGQFIWPASGRITQGYRVYHRAYDIANKGGGAILAADSGRVIVAGWKDNSGYGNRIIIDHGNGFVTLYGHLSSISVQEGQTVSRGNVIGTMGSTGRSTGVHLHFEIRRGGVNQDPGVWLR